VAAKAALVAALRSERYRQIRGLFQDSRGGYCAVGLAEHLQIDLGRRECIALIQMNDMLGLSFSEIADLIERGDYEVADRPPKWLSVETQLEQLAALVQTASHDGSDDLPPTPAVISVYPRRPILTGAIVRRLVAA
jgi:hypothetical protein